MRTFHKIIYTLLRPLLAVFLWLKFGYTAQKAKDLPKQYIVLANHATDYDPLFVSLSFPKHMYFVASEHVARWGLASKLIIKFLDPIFRYKGSVAGSTVKAVLQRLRGGANICLFAEGNRTWDGCTGEILPSTGKLVKKAGCGLVTYKLTGGYFVSPRWGSTLRRGPVHGRPVHIYTAEQLAGMTVDQVNAAICSDLAEDAYARQAAAPRRYRGKRLAEGMENLLFICPQCGCMDTITSQNDTVRCTACGMQMRYDVYGMLHGGPCTTMTQLSDHQKAQVLQHALAGETYTVHSATLAAISHSESRTVGTGTATLSQQALCCGDCSVPLDAITNMDIHGKRGLVFTADGVHYELRPQGNAIKFLLLYNCYKKLAEQICQV